MAIFLEALSRNKLFESAERKLAANSLESKTFPCTGYVLALSKFYGQATKGTRWMPWRVKAMKDVASCEKLR